MTRIDNVSAEYLDKLRLRILQNSIQSGACRVWLGARFNHGYGAIGIRDRSAGIVKTVILAHRAAYAAFVGQLDTDKEVHHTCKNILCVNPQHLKQLTRQQHMIADGTNQGALNASKTQCKRGHALSGDNLYISPTGIRSCRLCVAQRQAEYIQRKKNTHKACTKKAVAK